jgi:acyl carrier protein
MSVSHEQITSSIKGFITHHFFFNSDSFKLSDTTSFIENGIIDSTGILELINFIQKEFKISVEDHEMLPENLDSLNSIADYIIRKNRAS